MTNEIIIDWLYDRTKSLRETDVITSKRIFKEVVKNSAPHYNKVKQYPAIAFYPYKSFFSNEKTYEVITSQIMIYIYNRHRDDSNLSVDDIMTPIVDKLRVLVRDFEYENNDVLYSAISSSVQDTGIIYPIRINRLIWDVDYVDNICRT
jgi:hypothetical protein